MPDVAIQRWIPDRWDEVVGNDELRRFFWRELTAIKRSIAQTGTVPATAYKTLLVVGDNRTGKTALIKLFLRSLACLEPDADFNPCRRRCSICRQLPEKLSVEGLWSRICIGHDALPVDIKVVDCAKCEGASHLRKMLEEVHNWDDGLGVVFFDEAQRLRNGMGYEMMLKDMEEKNVLWIFCSARPRELDAMFLERCIILSTQLPTFAELEAWLAGRCVAWGIPYDPEAIALVARRSNRKPGLCLPALTQASVTEAGLTVDFVENRWIVRPD